MRAKLALIAALAAGMVVAPGASAAVTVGQASTAVTTPCGAPAGAVQALEAGPPSYVIPSAGVITSYTVFAAGGTAQLLILTRVSGTTYNVAAKSAANTAPGTGVLHTFPTQIPVQPGQLIGLYGTVCEFAGASGDQYQFFMGGEPAAGSDQDFGSTSTPATRLNLSATLEPDCDGDGFGDETQDSDLSSCAKTARAVTLDANKAKVKKRKKVTLFGKLEASGQPACFANQTIELQRARGTTFDTFEQIETDGEGNFITRTKVKKTYLYRAVVTENAACMAAVSDTQKVKAKKPKR